MLNENVATLTYLADTGDAGLTPAEGTPERYQYLNHVGFVATELHKGVGALFVSSLSPEAREAAKAGATKKIGLLLDGLLDGGKKRFLNGKTLSAADVYAYVVLSWSGFLGVPLTPEAQAYFDGIKDLEVVKKAPRGDGRAPVAAKHHRARRAARAPAGPERRVRPGGRPSAPAAARAGRSPTSCPRLGGWAATRRAARSSMQAAMAAARGYWPKRRY